MRLPKPISRGCCNILLSLSVIFQAIHLSTSEANGAQASEESIIERCQDCKLMSDSIEELIRKPRQLDLYGQMKDLLDLDRLKKNVCKNYLTDHERQSCRAFFFTNLASVDKWKQLKSKTNSYDTICIRELKLCCPAGSHGPKCSKCPKCDLNEQCHGEGTRRGTGKCVCRKGHQGPKCSLCTTGFYSPSSKPILNNNSSSEATGTREKLTCLPCHKSCKSCLRAGPLGCEVCNRGYSWSTTFGCSDIDECVKDSLICGTNTFCVNTEGSYYCYECDRACDGCHGDGPDMCLKCGRGYKLENGNCVALKKSILPPEANYYRYAIYAGLSICTCVILHNNVYIASVVGLAVAIYISVCEYVMSVHNSQIAKS